LTHTIQQAVSLAGDDAHVIHVADYEIFPEGLQRLPWPWGRLLGPPCKIPMTPLTSGIKAAASELDPVRWLDSTLYWPMTRLDISI
jgi:hypothetical protein